MNQILGKEEKKQLWTLNLTTVELPCPKNTCNANLPLF